DPVHAAKQIREYLDSLTQAGVKDVHALYSDLCAITHPSGESVAIWYEAKKVEHSVIWRRHTHSARKRLAEFFEHWKIASEGIINLAFIPAFMSLRILHKFDFLPKIPNLKSFPLDAFPIGDKLSVRLVDSRYDDITKHLFVAAALPKKTAMSAINVFGAKPLESFFPSLAELPSVQTALREEFGKDGSVIIAKMKAGESLSDEELGAHDIIHDIVHNNSVVTDSLAGWSSADNDIFPINVMQFGSVFWIEAPEFDDIGYFDTAKDAKEVAEANYERFITR